MVSHDIKEVVYMADRIVVLGANPGVVRTIVENRLPRPRDYRSPELLRARRPAARHHHRQRDARRRRAGTRRPARSSIEPLPDASPGEIVGLLEYLDARGGREDLFRIAADTHQEFGHVITVVKAAEMLDFVDTPKRMVVLEPEGQRFVKAPRPRSARRSGASSCSSCGCSPSSRTWSASRAEEGVESNFVLETLALSLPDENLERTFETIIEWGRFGDLFEYDEERELLTPPE